MCSIQKVSTKYCSLPRLICPWNSSQCRSGGMRTGEGLRSFCLAYFHIVQGEEGQKETGLWRLEFKKYSTTMHITYPEREVNLLGGQRSSISTNRAEMVIQTWKSSMHKLLFVAIEISVAIEGKKTNMQMIKAEQGKLKRRNWRNM